MVLILFQILKSLTEPYLLTRNKTITTMEFSARMLLTMNWIKRKPETTLAGNKIISGVSKKSMSDWGQSIVTSQLQ